MIYRLVLENLKHRPVRTLLSAIAIGVQVTLILTLVGVSDGMLGDYKTRSRGTGADVTFRPPNSSLFSLNSSGTMPQAFVEAIRQEPHVAQAMGTLVEGVGGTDSITGINLEEFDRMSGGLRFLDKLPGPPFQQPTDMIVDDVYARGHNLHPGDWVELSRRWHVTGIVQSGMLSRMFADINFLQEAYSAHGDISVIWIKADDPKNAVALKNALSDKYKEYKIYTVEEFVSLLSADNIPLLKNFTNVVIGIGAIVGFLVVFLSMYTAVLERTREIGILKALGASPGYILGILIRETILLTIVGWIVGILMTYGTQAIMYKFVPSMTENIVYPWWPKAGLIAIIGSIAGALYPGLKAAKQDAIEALAYD